MNSNIGMWCFQKRLPSWCPSRTWCQRLSGAASGCSSRRDGSTTWNTTQNPTSCYSDGGFPTCRSPSLEMWGHASKLTVQMKMCVRRQKLPATVAALNSTYFSVEIRTFCSCSSAVEMLGGFSVVMTNLVHNIIYNVSAVDSGVFRIVLRAFGWTAWRNRVLVSMNLLGWRTANSHIACTMTLWPLEHPAGSQLGVARVWEWNINPLMGRTFCPLKG